MEAGEYGLPRGTCFVARGLEVVAVAGLLWISWCVLGAAGFFVFFCRFFSSNARLVASMRQPCLFYLSTSNNNNLVYGMSHVLVFGSNGHSGREYIARLIL